MNDKFKDYTIMAALRGPDGLFGQDAVGRRLDSAIKECFTAPIRTHYFDATAEDVAVGCNQLVLAPPGSTINLQAFRVWGKIAHKCGVADRWHFLRHVTDAAMQLGIIRISYEDPQW